jgi:hypothetical protein
MLSPDSRICSLINGSLEQVNIYPVPVPVLGDEARSRGRILLSGAWNPSGFFNLPNLYALHDWYLVRAGSAGTLTVQIGSEQTAVTVNAATAEQNRVQVLWREVGKSRTLPVLRLQLRFVGDANSAFRLYPEDVGTLNIEWIDIEPAGGALFRTDIGTLTGNRWQTPLSIYLDGVNGAVDITTSAVVFNSTM